MVWPRLLLLLAPLAAQTLDFDIYRARVEPVFLTKRPGHARCVACHVDANTAFKLQPLNDGALAWTREQSQKNYDMILHLVVPGDPDRSRLLHHPLAPDAGGDKFHGGGHQFASRDDPAYKTIAEWIKGDR